MRLISRQDQKAFGPEARIRWDEKARGFRDGLDRLYWLPFIRTRAQAERWAAAGFDFWAAIARKLAFARAWDSAITFGEAYAALLGYVEDMEVIARAAGLGDDPEFPSIRYSMKAYEWGPGPGQGHGPLEWIEVPEEQGDLDFGDSEPWYPGRRRRGVPDSAEPDPEGRGAPRGADRLRG